MSSSDRKGATLGERLRLLRTRKGLSLRKLAERLEFAPSFLSQVENGQASPSIHSLERMARALGASLGDLFAQTAEPSILRSGAGERLTSGWSKAELTALGPMGPEQPLEAVMITLAPGGQSGKRPHLGLHDEFAFIHEGSVTLTIEGGEHRLRRGDAVSIRRQDRRLWQNPGRKPVRVVIVSVRVA